MQDTDRPKVSFLKLAGPGLVVAATGIGSGDVVSATVGGARYGVMLLWAIAAGAVFKFVLQEGIARWQLATGKTALEGWADHPPAWVKWVVVYLVLWTVAVSASLTNATGLGIANLTGGAISQSWGAVAHSLIGFAFVFLGGYGSFEKLMKLLVGVMGFSILFCAMFTLDNNAVPAVKGLLIPSIPAGSGTYVLSLIGGVGGSITMLSQLLEARKGCGGAGLNYARRHRYRHLFTAIFGGSIMLIANDAFYTSGGADQCRRGAAHGRGPWQDPGQFRSHRVFGRLLGGGVPAAGRVAERAVLYADFTHQKKLLIPQRERSSR